MGGNCVRFIYSVGRFVGVRLTVLIVFFALTRGVFLLELS